MIYRFFREQADDAALDSFLNKSNIREPRKRERLKALALEARRSIEDRVDIRAAVRNVDGFSLRDEVLTIEGTGGAEIICPAFRRLEEGLVQRVYAFVLSAGDFELDRSYFDDIYADLWGTAYADAGVSLLKQRLEEELEKDFKTEREHSLSDAFGPGFYGMGLSQLPQLFQLVDGGQIGVALKGSLMVPLKSCAGFFLLLRGPASALPPKDCRSCLGNTRGCHYCRNFRRESSL